MWDYLEKRVKIVSQFNLWTDFRSILYIRKEQRFVKFCSWTLENSLLWHVFHNFCLIWKIYDLLQSLFKCGSRVVHSLFNWTIVQSSHEGQGISGIEGPEVTASSFFPHIHPWIGNLTKMKVNLNLFPLVLQIPQRSYCIF